MSTADQTTPTAPPDAEYTFPVSPIQGRLLVLEHLHPGSAQHHVSVAFDVEGPFRPEVFHRALNALVARHESLRTRFRATGDELVQLVRDRPSLQYRLERHDVDTDTQPALLREIAIPFDLAQGPLLRCTIYRHSHTRHRLLLTAHHLICDGWSLQILLQEAASFYAGQLHGHVPALEPLMIQYPDYACWQHERLASGEYASAVAHWTQLLAGVNTSIALPTTKPRPAVQSPAGSAERFILPAQTVGLLRQVAADHTSTLFTALFAAFNVFLGRICDQEDLVIGIPVSGRERPELQTMIGMLANTVALRTDLSGDPDFGSLVERVRDVLDRARPHHDAPFDVVVSEVAPTRTLGRDPLVQVAFGYDDDTEMVLRLEGTHVQRIVVLPGAAQFDLTMNVERVGDDLAAQFIYRTDLFDPATIQHWVSSFLTLLNGLAQNPDRPISTIDLLGPADLRRNLHEWNHTETDVPDRLVADLVADRALERPEAVALVHGDTVLSYRELLQQADGLAQRLRARGVSRGDAVGLCLPRGVDMAVAALAVLRAGGAFVPLDPQHPPARLAYMLSDARSQIVLAAESTAGQLTESNVPIMILDGLPGTEGTPTALDGTGPDRPGSRDAAYILYTSGSTGTPKGVTIEHRALTNLATAVAGHFGITRTDRVLQYVSFGFDIAVLDLFMTWVAGGQLHITGESERFGEALATRLRDSAITCAVLPPLAARSMSSSSHTLPELKTLIVGGEEFPPELAELWSTPDRRLVNAYGPTEMTVCVTSHDVRPDRAITIGTPLPNTKNYVLDSKLRPLPVGVIGEIYLAGTGTARGYAHRPGATAERFVANPFGPEGSRMYRTGDLGSHAPDGALIFHGRSDRQVKLRGFRLELGEIEAVTSAHPDITAAVVDLRGSGEQQQLVLYVVASPGANPGTDDLQKWMGHRLPDYMLPDAIVALPTLPISPSGKLDRHRLPEPPRVRPARQRSGVTPTTPTQIQLAEIWSRVLRLDDIDMDDNFFDLGGNSLRLISVRNALVDLGNRNISLIDLFRNPTVATLAAHLDGIAEITPPHELATNRGLERRRRATEAIQARRASATSTRAER